MIFVIRACTPLSPHHGYRRRRSWKNYWLTGRPCAFAPRLRTLTFARVYKFPCTSMIISTRARTRCDVRFVVICVRLRDRERVTERERAVGYATATSHRLRPHLRLGRCRRSILPPRRLSSGPPTHDRERCPFSQCAPALVRHQTVLSYIPKFAIIIIIWCL